MRLLDRRTDTAAGALALALCVVASCAERAGRQARAEARRRTRRDRAAGDQRSAHGHHRPAAGRASLPRGRHAPVRVPAGEDRIGARAHPHRPRAPHRRHAGDDGAGAGVRKQGRRSRAQAGSLHSRRSGHSSLPRDTAQRHRRSSGEPAAAWPTPAARPAHRARRHPQGDPHRDAAGQRRARTARGDGDPRRRPCRAHVPAQDDRRRARPPAGRRLPRLARSARGSWRSWRRAAPPSARPNRRWRPSVSVSARWPVRRSISRI